ncbi:MAG: DNA gyrase subunit A [Gracilibacteraceae bacterium]|jgi:DNA gyrase subunit A|nr:DNA gyrase subunit A [Gracilibacteraceae bacterium]
MDTEITAGKILPVEIAKELKQSFMEYSMSVIVSRALPDVRDGLKPVHRRILYTLHEAGMTAAKPYSKAARLVGDCMGKYHPHGDSSIYDATVRMAQDFASRYPLVDGHGNFGSVDGDSPAAMRYTELRMASLTTYMLADLEKETVDFMPNYDEKTEEPTVLPAKFPNLLVNGSSGIAVGMATNIPPHNLGEVIDAAVYILDGQENPDFEPSFRELLRLVKGPDFPTAGIIMGTDGIEKAYATGRGSVKTRARANIETMEKSGRMQIVVTEIPYMVNKAKMVEKIAELVQEKKIEGISELRDESNRKGIRVVMELRRDANPQVVLNLLYKHTQMEEAFGVNMLALVDGAPRLLTLPQALDYFIRHQKEIIERRSRHDLKKAEAEAHIVEGLRKALDCIDEVIVILRSSRDDRTARDRLTQELEFTEIQAGAILDMRMRRLTGLEREKLDEQYQKLLDEIAYLQAVLASEKMVRGIIKTELLEIREKFADPRRTVIALDTSKMEVEDLIADEDVVITITNRGYIKRLPLATYRSQKRGGVGVKGMTTGENDFVENMYVASTHHYLLVFTSKGKVYRLRAHEVPEGGRTAKGTAIVNLLHISQDEKVTATMPVREFDADNYLLTATKKGVVKKTRLSEYDTQRRDGLIALTLDEDDELIGVRLTRGQDDVLLATRLGMVVRFAEEDIRSMGRSARGVRGIRLKPADFVIAMDTVEPGDAQTTVLSVTENGFAKRSFLTEYRKTNRGGTGIIGHRLTEKTGLVAGIKLVRGEEELMIITDVGKVIRQEVQGISVSGRASQGVKAVQTKDKDEDAADARVTAIAKFISRDED